MNKNLIQELTIVLDSICSYICETERTRQVIITPTQLWTAARFYMEIPKETVAENFEEVLDSYASLVIVRKSATDGHKVNIGLVEKYTVEGAPSGAVVSAVITHKEEYLELLGV